MPSWWEPTQDIAHGISFGAHRPNREVLLAHFNMGRQRLRVSHLLNVSQPFWDTKNQDANPQRVHISLGLYLFCKKVMGLGVGGSEEQGGQGAGAPPAFS